MRKFWIILVVLLFPLAVLAQGLADLTAEADDDRGFLTGLLERNLSGAGRQVVIEGFEGALSSRAGIIGDRYPSRGPLTPAG